MSMAERLTREELVERLRGLEEAQEYIEHEGRREDAAYFLYEIRAHVDAQDALLEQARKLIQIAGGWRQSEGRRIALLQAIDKHQEER